MISFTSGQARLRRTATLAMTAAIAFTFSACSPDEILDVETPDIIEPANVQSAAGAQGVRIGALARLSTATSGTTNGLTSGSESLLLLGGLFADEWNNGDSFIARQEVDRRQEITVQNTFLTTANRVLHRARLSADQALGLLAKYDSLAPGWQFAEMHFVQAYVVNLMAEHYCDGLVFSAVVDGLEQYGTPVTTVEAFQRALKSADDGLALIKGTTANDVRVQNALRVTRGRILLNLNRVTEAAAAVTAVPTTYEYTMLHSTTQVNAIWNYNNNQRRYSVSNNEGINGLNFATAGDPRVPVCPGGSTACKNIGVTQTTRDDLTQPLYVQMLWPVRESSVVLITGREARLIEAEAQLRAGSSTQSLGTLNTLRTGVAGLLQLPPEASVAARENQLFRERAFWLFSRGHRVGDLRRLIRQYGRAPDTVFPTGLWHKDGNYGTDVNLPVPFAEANNPNVPAAGTCMNRNA